MLKKCLSFATTLYLFLLTVIDTLFSGFYVTLISILTGKYREIIYKWAEDWGKRALKRYKIQVKTIGKGNWDNAKRVLVLANHQSMAEVFLVSDFMREDLVFVGKKSIKWIPGFGWLFMLSKQILLDRFNREKAIKGLEIANKRVNEGYSLYLAPEGTRSPNGALGRLKKGFFHLALETKAPILPLTYVNIYKIQPKHSIKINSGEALLIFDQLIETKDWKPDEVDLRREQLREIYQKNLNKYGDPCQFVPLELKQYPTTSL